MYYFDVTETFIKTVAVDADNLEQAMQRVETAYRREEFEVDHTYCDEIEFKNVDESELLQTEDLDELDCHELIYNKEDDAYHCPVCDEYIINRPDSHDLEYAVNYCSRCGTKLE